MRHLPDRGEVFIAAAVSSAAIPYGSNKKSPSECSSGNHIRHSYRMGLATTTTAASGREEVVVCSSQQDARAAPRHARMLGAWPEALKKSPLGSFCRLRAAVFLRFLGLVTQTATTLDVSSRWDPRTKQQPTGLIAPPAAQGPCCSIPAWVKPKTPLRNAQRRFYIPHGNRTHVTAVKGPCLNRLTNLGLRNTEASLKPPTSIVHSLQTTVPLTFSETL